MNDKLSLLKDMIRDGKMSQKQHETALKLIDELNAYISNCALYEMEVNYLGSSLDQEMKRVDAMETYINIIHAHLFDPIWKGFFAQFLTDTNITDYFARRNTSKQLYIKTIGYCYKKTPPGEISERQRQLQNIYNKLSI
jgi:hypothetical protein